MENKKITIYNGSFKIKVVEEALKYKNLSFDELIEFLEGAGFNYDRYNYSEGLEGFKDACYDHAGEYAESGLSIFNHDIMDDFTRLQHWEVDEIIENSGWIEYNTADGFINVARAVLAEREIQKIDEDIEDIIPYVEIVEYDEEGREQVKKDIIKYLNNYRDLEVEKMARDYKDGRISTIEWINEYICEINYCSYMAVGDGPYLKGWDIYKYYYIDLYLDKDIQQAVVDYVIEIDEEREAHKKRNEEETKKTVEKVLKVAEDGDIEEVERVIGIIDKFFNSDEEYQEGYRLLHLRLEYLNTLKYIEELRAENSTKENKVEQVAETMKAMRNSKSIEELSKFIIELMN